MYYGLKKQYLGAREFLQLSSLTEPVTCCLWAQTLFLVSCEGFSLGDSPDRVVKMWNTKKIRTPGAFPQTRLLCGGGSQFVFALIHGQNLPCLYYSRKTVDIYTVGV